MISADLTVIVTAQTETVVAGPAMRSAEIAIGNAEAAGFVIERVISLDKASHLCREYFQQSAFAAWKKVEYDFADPYITRNASVENSLGRWIAFLDADDLFSENWLVTSAKLLVELEGSGGNVIVHPEINWIFDGAIYVFAKLSQDDLLFYPEYFYLDNPYDMLCMAPRKAYLEIPYVKRDVNNGFGYGDWQWNIETMASSWRHVIAENTIIFKRRRDTSVFLESSLRKSVIHQIEPMAIDRLKKLGR
ncbi:MAG: hypothetical protein CTY31_06295 [Hyphomicrobium sp.]|nr:MAG: hypothetical protein CTY31_06295 [Hyphomicrobium sp.]